MTVNECFEHPWFSLAITPELPLSSSPIVTDTAEINQTTTNTNITTASSTILPERCSTPQPDTVDLCTTPESIKELPKIIKTPESKSTTTGQIKTIYCKPKSPITPLRIGLTPDRRDTFKKNMDSLAQKFSSGAEIVIIEQTSSHQRRAIGNHTMPAGDVFKCTPVFILGEEQQCSDSGSDTVSEISTDSSSDRSSIYSDDSLDFILYGKSQGRASFPFAGTESDRWDRHHTRVWPRECNGVVSKALSRFTTDPSSSRTSKSIIPPSSRAKTGLEALRERGGNLVVIREPVKAGRYTRYSEVQCESVQARIRRFQIQGES